MKLRLLLSLFCISLFTMSCEQEEMVQPKSFIQPNIALPAGVITSVDAQRQNLLVEGRFEPTLGTPFSKQVYTSYGLGMSTTVKRSGSNAAKMEMRKGDGSVRSEILLPGETQSNRWYGMGLYLPSANWATDNGVECWDVITQFHCFNDPGEPSRNPPIALSVIKGRLTLVVHWSTKAINTSPEGKKEFDLGPIEKDKWLDMVYHINYSYRSDGLIQIWKNGKEILKYSGPNSYNDKNYPYLKMGIYRRRWSDVSKRVIYVDDVRVGNSSATYKDVAPSGTAIDTPPPPTEDPTKTQPLTLVLMNADTHQPIQNLVNGAVLDLATLPTKNLNVQATTSAAIGSVMFNLMGAQTSNVTQSGAPYALFGDVNGKYLPWTPAVGDYSLTATAYSAANGTGTASTPLNINFQVKNQTIVDPTSFQPLNLILMNADTQQPIQNLVNGAVLDLATLPTKNLNVQATSGSIVGSVVFNLTGAQTSNVVQSGAPYALFGDVNGKYQAWTPTVGAYSLTATAYSGSNGTGTAGTPVSLTFQVKNQNSGYETLAPTATVVINNDDATTNFQEVTLKITNTGATEMRFYDDNDDATWSQWEPIAASKNWVLSAGEGSKWVKVQVRNAAGVESTSTSDIILLKY